MVRLLFSRAMNHRKAHGSIAAGRRPHAWDDLVSQVSGLGQVACHGVSLSDRSLSFCTFTMRAPGKGEIRAG